MQLPPLSTSNTQPRCHNVRLPRHELLRITAGKGVARPQSWDQPAQGKCTSQQEALSSCDESHQPTPIALSHRAMGPCFGAVGGRRASTVPHRHGSLEPGSKHAGPYPRDGADLQRDKRQCAPARGVWAFSPVCVRAAAPGNETTVSGYKQTCGRALHRSMDPALRLSLGATRRLPPRDNVPSHTQPGDRRRRRWLI